MEEKTIEIDGKSYKIKELKYKDVAELQDLSKAESAKKLLQLSTRITDEDYNNLSMSTGIDLMKEVNKINNIDENFQRPTQI